MNYEPVIGLEVHVELNTKSKMFCRCSADYFGKEPNTHACPICLGLPGSLPYINQQAIEDCIKIGLALNCQIAPKSRFERKNYFYPDLPKGYQISQYRWSLCFNGWLDIENGNKKRIRINRVHQEEDTGKLIHLKDKTLVDFNRSGVPLVEIVTEPNFEKTSEVKNFAKKLQQLCRYLNVSNADMERGDMRFEANVSVRPVGQTELPPYRVELKNINSFRFMVAAIEYEIKRQIEALERGEKLTQETRGWNENKKETYLQRSKEEAHDYRYFPEPDLPPIRYPQTKILKLKAQISELPDDKKARFVKDYGLTYLQAEILTQTRQIADFFEEAAREGKKHGITDSEIANTIINKRLVWERMLPRELIQALVKGKKPKVPKGKIEIVTGQVIKENQKTVADYKNGKIQALGFLVGQVVKLLPEVDPRQAKVILEERLSKGEDKNG